MLRAGLNNAVVSPSGFDHQPAFADVVRQRFFDVNIFACRASQHGNRRVPVIWSRDVNRLNFLRFQQFSKIAKRFGRASRPSLRAQRVCFVHIANRAVFDAGNVAHQRRNLPSAPAATDQTDYDAIIRANNPFVRKRRRGNHGCSGDCRIDEFSSFH